MKQYVARSGFVESGSQLQPLSAVLKDFSNHALCCFEGCGPVERDRWFEWIKKHLHLRVLGHGGIAKLPADSLQGLAKAPERAELWRWCSRKTSGVSFFSTATCRSSTSTDLSLAISLILLQYIWCMYAHLHVGLFYRKKTVTAILTRALKFPCQSFESSFWNLPGFGAAFTT